MIKNSNQTYKVEDIKSGLKNNSNNSSKNNKRREYVCAYCGNEIFVNNHTIYDLIRYDNKNYHKQCFQECCEKKSVKKGAYAQKWADALQHYNDIVLESLTFYENKVTRDTLNKFLQEEYGLAIIPSNFWQRIADLNTGKYKQIGTKVPTSDILEMWQIQIKKLNAIAEYNKAHGKTMTKESRLIYDLAILIGKYNGFLEWKERQKILQANKEIERKKKESDKIITDKIVIPKVKFKRDDILELVNDIFG